jgi:microcompartment protein CcmL/EutN
MSAFEALAVVEIASIARGWVALDQVAKKAPVSVKLARAVSPGKHVMMFGGDVESTRESHAVALEVAGSDLVDEVFLAGAHPRLLPALDGVLSAHAGSSIGLVELSTVAAAVGAADAALKVVDVDVVAAQLAVGIGGKGTFTLVGALADVEAALLAVRAWVHPERVLAIELIAQPHAEVRGFIR